jgi:ribonuclease P protein component
MNLSENTGGGSVKFSFKKDERLCSKKIIDRLFLEGKSFFVYPVKIVYLETKIPTNSPAQAAFSVAKRNFKRAVQRNLIKRRMREVYRLNKMRLYDKIGEKQVAVFFIYTGKTILEYNQIESAIIKGIKMLITGLKTDS